MSKFLSIGDFSTVSHLTVKALRFYHEKGVLVPARVEAGTGYRFYTPQQVERATVIRRLRDLEFSIREIQELLSESTDDHDIVNQLQSKHDNVRERIAVERRVQRMLAQIIQQVKEH